MKKHYFTVFERVLWGCSVLLIGAAFLLFDRSNYLAMLSSLIGVTALIFSAKGNPWGPGLMIPFSLLYGYISLTFAYYGEMITYVGMTLPMSIVAVVGWLRNPYKGRKSEVAVAPLTVGKLAGMLTFTAVVTLVFYFILAYFHTANLIPSTVSVATSFAAAYLTYLRSPYFALAYAANDVVLIVLWAQASLVDRSYVSVFVCFVIFLINDLYGFCNWKRMQDRQKTSD
ncbi:MAG: nicotinamide mononucleotide transporter [Clostridia bacterium]|nr:nicotinamide mononucleotide transporter [Clostridia bacterium]